MAIQHRPHATAPQRVAAAPGMVLLPPIQYIAP